MEIGQALLSGRKFNEILTRNLRGRCEFLFFCCFFFLVSFAYQLSRHEFYFVLYKLLKERAKKKSKRKYIWSFCAALQVVGHKPARQPAGECVAEVFGGAKVFTPRTTTAYSKHLPTLAQCLCVCVCRCPSVRTVPGRAFPLHAKHSWPLSQGPQKSAPGAYKLITWSKGWSVRNAKRQS